MKRIVVFGEKGGCGKTTVSVVISRLLNLHLYDLDPQKSATHWLGEEPRQTNGGWIADCAPGLGFMNVEMLDLMKQAQLFLVPVKTSFTDLMSVGQTLKFIKAHASSSAHIAFVGSTVDARSNDESMLREGLAPYKYPIAGIFTHRASYRRAGLSHALPGDSDPVAAAEADALINYIKEVTK